MVMALFQARERALAERVSELAFENPFGPRRVELEREILGAQYVAGPGVWTPGTDRESDANSERIGQRAEALLSALRRRPPARLDRGERGLYRDLVFYASFHAHEAAFFALVEQSERGEELGFPDFPGFCARLRRDLAAIDEHPSDAEAAHYLACMFQIRRAFHHIFHRIVGVSAPVARLRVDVWRSVFTHDLRRYVTDLYPHVGQLPTLVTGPSGSGKELVIRAIALSRYVGFEPRRARFTADFSAMLFPLSVPALPTTLVESELFGHRRGAFTGATQDRVGYLEQCPATGTVFLDEIGDLEPIVQVKLLRLLQDGSYQRVGESRRRSFLGKIAAATHRDLAALLADGRFRDDLYYRLCADRIETPSLAERLRDEPNELALLLELLARRWLGLDAGRRLAGETLDYLNRHLPADYAWPGNVRELEQCLRSVLLRRAYHPPRAEAASASVALAAELEAGRLEAEELMVRYVRHVHALAGSQVAAARRLGLDRRTVARYLRTADRRPKP
jgi:transcriptional regulator with AAA-type ATPase domain